MQTLRSIVFTIFLFVFTPLAAVPVAASAVLPFRQRYAVASWWASVVLWMLKATCGLDYTVEGREHLPAGNFVSMWKHSSAWETIAMMVLLPPSVWVLKRELMRIPLVGWGLAALKPIAIDRAGSHSAMNQVVEQGRARLAEGLRIVIFPEGTRVAAGTRRRYGLSGPLLAVATNTPIVPVAHNSGDFWPRRGVRKARGVIRVVFGPPIDPIPNDPRGTGDRVQAWIEATVERIRSEPPAR